METKELIYKKKKKNILIQVHVTILPDQGSCY